jgi:hypothetical protein
LIPDGSEAATSLAALPLRSAREDDCFTRDGHKSVKPAKRDNRTGTEGETMNATPNTNSLAAAFATAVAAFGAPQRPAPIPAPTPSQQLDANRSTRLTHDELLLAVLRHSLTPADQFIARRTLLCAAPWEAEPI